MRAFFDAYADGHFMPQDDGTVRFTMPGRNSGYLVLSDAESEGAKGFWQILVQFYFYACHAFALIGLFVPWLGVLLLVVAWQISLSFNQAIRRRYSWQGDSSASDRDWKYYRLAQVISCPTVLWLRRLAVVASCVLPALIVLEVFVDFPKESPDLMTLTVVSFYWLSFFNKLVSSPKAKAYWAQPPQVGTEVGS